VVNLSAQISNDPGSSPSVPPRPFQGSKRGRERWFTDRESASAIARLRIVLGRQGRGHQCTLIGLEALNVVTSASLQGHISPALPRKRHVQSYTAPGCIVAEPWWGSNGVLLGNSNGRATYPDANTLDWWWYASRISLYFWIESTVQNAPKNIFLYRMNICLLFKKKEINIRGLYW